MTTSSKTNVLPAEARLGFNYTRGLSRSQHVARQIPCLSDLLDAIDDINRRHSTYNTLAVRQSKSIEQKANEVFHRLGPSLWPDCDEINGPFPSWLLQPLREAVPNNNPFYNLYPRSLYYSKPGDRAILRDGFYELICNKVLKYHGNQRHRRPFPKYLEGSEAADDSSSELTQLSDAVSDFDACIDPRTNAQSDKKNKEEHEDDEDGSGLDINAYLRAHVVEDDEEDEDYSPTRPRRARSFDTTPHSSVYGAMPPFRAPTANMMGNTQTKVAQAKQEVEAARRCQYQKHYNTSGNDRRERQTSRHDTPLSASRQPPINGVLGRFLLAGQGLNTERAFERVCQKPVGGAILLVA